MTSPRLWLHFGYHKCLTLFFSRVYRRLGEEFGITWLPVYDDAGALEQAIFGTSDPRIVMVTDNGNVPWARLPPYRACHVIRDPRDLVVSGYFYHLWTDEAWCRDATFDWSRITALQEFRQVEPNEARWPTGVSYQEYLNSLEQEQGLLLETLSRRDSFEQMSQWNYENEHVLELRYEDIAGNELEQCRRLFRHFGFNEEVFSRGEHWAETFSLNNMKRKEGTHIRSGRRGQWRDLFTPGITEMFRQNHGQLLIELGYESGRGWA